VLDSVSLDFPQGTAPSAQKKVTFDGEDKSVRQRSTLSGFRHSMISPGVTGGAPQKSQPCKKNQRKFWDLLIYSRILSWGREYKIVANYIFQNTLEALNLIAYKPRKPRRLRRRKAAD
jgi:hypothetical protein